MTGLAYVKLRDLTEKYGGAINWNTSTATASIYLIHNPNQNVVKYTADSRDGDGAKLIGNTMYVDEEVFNKQFGIYVGGDTYGIITQNEMDEFENGKMAPAAYTYLMKLTYDWYLAGANGEKTKQRELLNASNLFRGTGYTNVYFDPVLCEAKKEEINKNIKYMPALPTGNITQEQHYFRNKLNIEYDWSTFQKLQAALPDNLKWADDVPADYHQNNQVDGKKNIKWVSADGHFEMIFNTNDGNYGAEESEIYYRLQSEANNPDDMGTYNYTGSNIDMNGHDKMDVDTWYKWENTRALYDKREEITKWEWE